MNRPTDTIETPEDGEPSDVYDRLAWEYEWIEENAEENDETTRPE
jgi:hypothetical protein